MKGSFYMKVTLRTLYSILLIGAEVLYFINVEVFRRMISSVLLCKTFIVKFRGVLEILFSVLLWVKSKNNLYGKLIALFMIAVFPANVYMALKKIPFKPGTEANPYVLYGRLPLQIPLIIGSLKLGRR